MAGGEGGGGGLRGLPCRFYDLGQKLIIGSIRREEREIKTDRDKD